MRVPTGPVNLIGIFNQFTETPEANNGYQLLETEVVLLGDLNQDEGVGLLDVQPFLLSLTGGEFIAEADVNGDGAVNLLDVEPFIGLLSGA